MRRWWTGRKTKPEPEAEVETGSRTAAELMIRLAKTDVYYLHIAKNGSTFLKNLFYYIEHGTPHPDGDDIHGAPELQRAEVSEGDDIRASTHAFAVIRDPLDRFLSLYFDKIYSDSPRNFPDLQTYFTDSIGLDLTPGLTPEGHRHNCHLLAAWIGANLAGKTDQPVNFHWRRQARRLQRVAPLELEILTLDGLDWQLPLLLEDVLPDIRQAMAAISTRNVSVAPVDRRAVVDATLTAQINWIYAADRKVYQAARLKWEPWRASPAPVSCEEIRCFTAPPRPFHVVAPPKNGRTYMRNLVYVLEHGESYPEPLKIHIEGVVSTSDPDIRAMRDATGVFVVRDPLERFFSLYFDKIYGTGERAFPWITKRLVQNRGFVTGPDLSLEQHRANCFALLGFLERESAQTEPAELNPHWRPQILSLDKAIRFGMQPLMLDQLESQLLQVAGHIDGMAEAMALVPHRNASEKPYAMAEILTPEMQQRISALYAADCALYERVKCGWLRNGAPPKLRD